MKIGNTLFVFFKLPKPLNSVSLVKYTSLEKELESTSTFLFSTPKKKLNYYLTDEDYKTTTTDEVAKLLEVNFIKNKTWKWDVYDCDQYAFSLKGLIGDVAGNLTFGIVFVETNVGKHALNIFRDNKAKWHYVEPQTNEIFEVRGAKAIREGYNPYLIII